MTHHEEVAAATETSSRKVSDRKTVIIYQSSGVVAHVDFVKRSEASKFVNSIGAENVIAIYTGAKPAQLKTKVSL